MTRVELHVEFGVLTIALLPQEPDGARRAQLTVDDKTSKETRDLPGEDVDGIAEAIDLLLTRVQASIAKFPDDEPEGGANDQR